MEPANILNLSPQIAAALIGAAATLAAVIIAALLKRKKPQPPYKGMADAFRFGYHTYALYYWTKLSAFQKLLNETSDPPENLTELMKLGIAEERRKVKSLSAALGITFTASPLLRENMSTEDLVAYRSEVLSSVTTLPYEIQRSVEAGQRISGSFWRVYFMLFAAYFRHIHGDVTGDLKNGSFVAEIHSDLKEAEKEFAKAGLKKSLLDDLIHLVQLEISHLTSPRENTGDLLLDAVTEIVTKVDAVAARITRLAN